MLPLIFYTGMLSGFLFHGNFSVAPNFENLVFYPDTATLFSDFPVGSSMLFSDWLMGGATPVRLRDVHSVSIKVPLGTVCCLVTWSEHSFISVFTQVTPVVTNMD